MEEAQQANEFFAKKAEEVGIKVPYEFVECTTVRWHEVIENLEAVLRGYIDKKLRKEG